ncbi:hypothetical protein WA026_005444 [Henosepilachna vigintioctopunctata]|uniref:Uncharacterized protein n=1 Tax=Henosepilachna vigintioctopunctata TaxID=420089 RepID=A0AAW1U1T3_9CUCU
MLCFEIKMITLVSLLPLVFFIEGYAAAEKELPTYIKKCLMKNRECVMKSSNDAIPFIVKGDPEYKVPNMQPLQVSFISLINTPQLTLNLSNLEIFGLEEAKMTDFMVDEVHDMHFTLVLSIPNTTIKGEYSVSGQVLVLPIRGNGNFSMSLRDQVNKLLNENWSVLVTEFGPGISSVVTKTIQRIFNVIARKVPARNVFISE